MVQAGLIVVKIWSPWSHKGAYWYSWGYESISLMVSYSKMTQYARVYTNVHIPSGQIAVTHYDISQFREVYIKQRCTCILLGGSPGSAHTNGHQVSWYCEFW